MPRPAKFTHEQILEVASEIIAGGGPAAATIGEIATRLGAPSGSIYHRFSSRDELLGSLWLQKAAAFQDAFARSLEQPDPRQAAVDAALSMPRTVRADFNGARIMLLHRREDFMSTGWPAAMTREAKRLGEQIDAVVGEFAVRLFGRNTKAARFTTSFAIIDVPFAAVRRHVLANEVPPLPVDQLIATAVTAILDQPHGETRTTSKRR